MFGWSIRISFPGGEKVSLSCTAFRAALEPTESRVHWIPSVLRVKQWDMKVDHSPPSSTEVKMSMELYLHIHIHL